MIDNGKPSDKTAGNVIRLICDNSRRDGRAGDDARDRRHLGRGFAPQRVSGRSSVLSSFPDTSSGRDGFRDRDPRRHVPGGDTVRPSIAHDVTPIEWWRRFPADQFGDAEQLLLQATLDRVSVLRARKDVPAALRGDPVAAIRSAARLMPITRITLSTDLAMSGLLRAALAGDQAARLVLGSALKGARCGDLDGLATSWLDSASKSIGWNDASGTSP